MSGNQNSRIEDYLGVIRKILDDIAALTESVLPDWDANFIKRECDRDFAYIQSRALHEGISFLTISLPRLGKWYDSVWFGNSEDLGLPVGFKPTTVVTIDGEHFACPVFCKMFYLAIKKLRESASQQARVIRAYRSLFYLFYKLEVPFTPEQLSAAQSKWESIEAELETFEYPDYYDSDLIRVREILSELMRDVSLRSVRDFRHGPGAVAAGEDAEGKWETFTKFHALHQLYPRYDLYMGYRSEGRISPAMAKEYADLVARSPEAEYGVAKLLFVPKDSRGPRTICCEPKEYMFVQQAIARRLMPVLEARSRNRINFYDQSVNSNLALQSSCTGDYATLDLRDASDRVGWRLIKLLFSDDLIEVFEATRSQAILLPDGRVHHPVHKYAPMGSALCFPVQSMLFWAACVVASENSGMSQTDAKATTYVFGDDLIVRTQAADHAVRILSKLGLEVNLDKTYAAGPFRESCGMDAYQGYPVTPLRLRGDPFRLGLDGTLATSLCEKASSCFALNLRNTGEHLLALVERRYPHVVRIPYGSVGCLHVVDPLFFGNIPKTTWNRRLCRLETTGWVLTTPQKPCRLQGLSRFLRATYGHWELHDPEKVVHLRRTLLRKRRVSVEGLYLYA